jgi:hypothetical protein
MQVAGGDIGQLTDFEAVAVISANLRRPSAPAGAQVRDLRDLDPFWSSG